MKKSSTWAGIIGGLLIASSGYGLAEVIANPTSLFMVNVAMVIDNLLWLGFGAFLVFLFFKFRRKEDGEVTYSKPVSDSSEDMENLARKRNWILGFVLCVETIGSAGAWLLNNYATLSLINIGVIFDLILHLVFVYIIFGLFRGKKNSLNILFYAAIAYSAGWILISVLRGHWFGPLLSLVLGVYFVYAIKAPVNRKNHRLAHLVILPIFLVLLSVAPYFDNGKITELNKKDALVEQQFSDETGNLGAAYNLFLQKESPGKKEIENIRNSITRRVEKQAEIASLYGELRREYEKQIPSVSQKKMLEKLRYFTMMFDVHSAQAAKIGEIMDYSEKVNFGALTDKQITDILALEDEVKSLESRLTELRFELADAHLEE